MQCEGERNDLNACLTDEKMPVSKVNFVPFNTLGVILVRVPVQPWPTYDLLSASLETDLTVGVQDSSRFPFSNYNVGRCGRIHGAFSIHRSGSRDVRRLARPCD